MRTARWFLAGLAVVTFLAFASLKAPERMRLLGWFGVGVGALAGYLLGRIGQYWRIASSRVVLLLAFVLVLFGQVLAAAEMYRVRTAWLQAHFQKDPLSGADAQRVAGEQDAVPIPELPQVSKEEMARARQELLSPLRFFSERLMLVQWKPLDWIHNAPWPVTLWSIEVLLAATVGAYCTARVLRPPPQPSPVLASRTEFH